METKHIVGALAVVLVFGAGYMAYANGLLQDAQSQAISEQTTNQMGDLNSGENPAEGDQVHNLPVEPAAAKARADLATKLGVAEKSIVIMLIEEKTWGDGCLGLGGPAESCLMALVDGFRVELVHSGNTYVYRTDKTGAAIRAEQ